MISLKNKERKEFSQNGEDGITEELIELFWGKKYAGYYVEFGVEDGMECNTRILRERHGWTGLLMDGSHENAEIGLHKEFITRENIIDLFQKYKVPEKINLLSIDIDYNDFYVLNEIIKKYEMDIIITEYNGTHFPFIDAVVKYEANTIWDRTNYCGASLLALYNLLKTKYTLIYCDNNGVNAFFINNTLAKKYKFWNANQLEYLWRQPRFGWGPNGGHKPDPKNRKWIKSSEIIDVLS